MFTKDTLIKDILQQAPSSLSLLMDFEVRCLGWSAPWMTLEQAARGKQVNGKQIDLDKVIEGLEKMRKSQE